MKMNGRAQPPKYNAAMKSNRSIPYENNGCCVKNVTGFPFAESLSAKIDLTLLFYVN